MLSEKQRLLDWMFQQTFTQPRVKFQDLLTDAAEKALGKSRIDSEVYAQSRLNEMWNWILERLEDEKEKGLYPTFVPLSQNIKDLWWYPGYFQKGIKNKERYRKLRLRAKPKLLDRINTLTSREYEAIGCLVCELSGGTKFCLTPHGNEYGIDFFAVLPVTGQTHVFRGGGGPLRIVGQSKFNQTRRVEPKIVDQLMTTLDKVKYRSPDVDKLIPPWFHTAKGPIVGWIIAHNGLSTGAAESNANHYGIIHSDSRDVAEIIAMSRIWSLEADTADAIRKMLQELERILNTPPCSKFQT